MYKEHEAFTPPLSDTVLWRYMDFTKFVSLLEKQALFFARADKHDPFEGAWPNLSRVELQNFFERLTDPSALKCSFKRCLPQSRHFLGLR